MVRDRDAVGVAREVVEHGRGPAKRRLRIDDPGVATQGVDARLKRRRCLDGRERRREDQTLLTRGDLEPRQEPVGKGPRQGADGKEKRRAGRHPAVAVDVEGAPEHDAVQVDVEAELLIPRVEDREHAELAAQVMARIGAEGEEGVGHRLEEDLVQTRLVRQEERVEVVGHGEDGVTVVDGQQLRLPRPGSGGGRRRGFRRDGIAIARSSRFTVCV